MLDLYMLRSIIAEERYNPNIVKSFTADTQFLFWLDFNEVEHPLLKKDSNFYDEKLLKAFQKYKKSKKKGHFLTLLTRSAVSQEVKLENFIVYLILTYYFFRW